MEVKIVIMPSGQINGKITMEGVDSVIKELTALDKEFGIFIVAMGNSDNETISLDTYSNLKVNYCYCKTIKDTISIDYEIKVEVEGWEKVKELYKLLLDSNFEEVKNILTTITKDGYYNFNWLAKMWHNKNEEEIKLETYGNLIVNYSFTGDEKEEKIEVQMDNLEVMKDLYVLFQNSKFDRIKKVLRNKIDSNAAQLRIASMPSSSMKSFKRS